jgi:ubiquinone/menaquinone biosynthesis C-methylase UbiE
MNSSWLRRRALPLFFVTTFVPIVALAQRSGTSLGNQEIFEAIGVREGATACEIGAGDGELSIAAARVVGPTGRVLTSELGDDRVNTLRNKIAASGLAQITVVAGHAGSTNFPDDGCDAVFMRDVYHHFSDPAAMNASILHAVKPGGRVAIVDFTPPGDEASRPAERGRDGKHGVKPDTVAREMTEAGFEIVPIDRSARRWFLAVFSKPST